MKHHYEFSIDKAPHFLAKRKPNKQVDTILSELLPHHTQLICTQDQFDDFRDVMYALGFVVLNEDKYNIGADGRKLAKPPVKDV